MSAIEVYTNVKCGGGTPYGVITDWIDCDYGDALDGTGICTMTLNRDSAAFPNILRGRVLRILEATSAVNATPTVVEYRIKRITDKLTESTATIEAVPILHDLSDVRVFIVVGGIPTYSITTVAQTPTQIINTYVLPSLAAYGISWVTLGTITPTLTTKLTNFTGSCMALLRELVLNTDYSVRLTRNADVGYTIDLVNLNSAASQPVTLVGRNVEILDRIIDGYPQATIILGQGGTPAGATQRNDVGEYAVKCSAVSATQVTTVDPDGNIGPIYWTNQNVGLFLEKLQPHKWIWNEGSPNTYVSVTPSDVCLATTGNRIWVTTAGGDVNVYNADTQAFVTKVSPGSTPKGILYHAGTDQVFVALSGSNVVKVYTESTRVLAATITVGNAPSYMARASSNDRIYVTNVTDNTVSEINPNTNAVTNTISGFSAVWDIAYGSGPDRLMVTNTNNGNLYLVNPGTHAITNTLASAGIQYGVTYRATGGTVGYFYVTRNTGNTVEVWDPAGPTRTSTLTGFTSPGFCFYDSGADKVYVANNTTDFAIIDPTGPTFTGSVYVAGAIGRLGARISAQGVFLYTVPSGRGFFGTFMPATSGLAIRRAITASDSTAQTETMASTAPIAVGDFLSFRTDINGGWRSDLSNPTKKGAPPGGYGPIVRVLDRADLRTERNYVLNPWTRDFNSGTDAPYTDLEPGVNNIPQFIYAGADGSNWKSFAAQANGIHSPGSTVINLKGMTTGDVIEPGDYFSVASLMAGSSGTVDGSGHVTVQLFPQALSGSLTDGQAVTVERSGINLLGSKMYVPNQCLVVPHVPVGGAISIGKYFPVPFIAGRTSVQATIEVDVWRYGSFVPSTTILAELRADGVVVTSVAPTDAVSYSGKDLVTYTFSMTYTLTTSRMLSLWIRGLGTTATFTMYPKRFQVTLGSESNILPAFEIQPDHGELYHAGQRALRDLQDPVVQYQVSVIEDDPALPYLLGGKTNLQDPERAIAVTPRVVNIRRKLPPPNWTGVGQRPILQLDNQSPSLVRTLAHLVAL